MGVTTPRLFQRQATGLVREAGTWSTLIYNINFVSVGLMMLFVIQLEPAFYPGGAMLVSGIIKLAITPGDRERKVKAASIDFGVSSNGVLVMGRF